MKKLIIQTSLILLASTMKSQITRYLKIDNLTYNDSTLITHVDTALTGEKYVITNIKDTIVMQGVYHKGIDITKLPKGRYRVRIKGYDTELIK